MLTLLECADMLAELTGCEDVYAGCIDCTKMQTIGVYQRSDFVPRECIGSISSYQKMPVRVLIHWTLSPAEAEKKAYEILDIITGLRDLETSGHIIKFAVSGALRSLGKDEKGVCEYVVDADLIYTERIEDQCQIQQ